MPFHGLFGSLLSTSLAARVFLRVGKCILGVTILGWAVEKCGPRGIEVIVHVEESNVEVTLGDQTYQFEARPDRSIVCELPAGWHHLVMRRGEQILFEESFEVRPGENVVRSAYDTERIQRQHRFNTQLQRSRFQSTGTHSMR